MAAIRVLQVLSDTDASDTNLAAIELHGVLAAAGVEMRTLALGPGARGELAATVPVISPSRRSIAAHTQLRDEQRWADVLVLRGAEVAAVAAFVRVAAPRLLVLGDEPQLWAEGRHPGARVRRAASSCAAIIVPWAAVVEPVSAALGVEAGRVRALPTPIPCRGGTTTPQARAAARAMAEVSDDQVAVRVLWNRAKPGRSGAIEQGRYRSAEFRERLGDGMTVLSPSLEPELMRAATDIVVELDGRAGPSPELLRSVLAGAVAVTPDRPALGEVFQDDVTARTCAPPMSEDELVDVLRALAVDAPRRERLGTAGAARIIERHAAEEFVPRWLDTLRSALPSHA